MDAAAHRFLGVLDEVAVPGEVDAVVVTADLADHGAPGGHDQFFAALERAVLPYLGLPGNSDARRPPSIHLPRSVPGGALETIEASGHLGAIAHRLES